MFGTMPDEMFDHEPSSFDDAKRGWHGDAMKKMPGHKLVQLLAMIGAETIEEACERIDGMGKEGYMHMLSMYDDGNEEEERGMY